MNNKNFEVLVHEFFRFSEVFFPESDRAAIVLGASKLDNDLERMISKLMLPSADAKDDELFGSDKPLSTFSSKINIAYRLGLIDEEFRKMLHTFRKIRNVLAHDIYNCELNKQPISNHLKNLEDLAQKDEMYIQLVSKFPKVWADKNESAIIKSIIVYLSSRLIAMIDWVKPVHQVNESYKSNNSPKKS